MCRVLDQRSLRERPYTQNHDVDLLNFDGPKSVQFSQEIRFSYIKHSNCFKTCNINYICVYMIVCRCFVLVRAIDPILWCSPGIAVLCAATSSESRRYRLVASPQWGLLKDPLCQRITRIPVFFRDHISYDLT